MENEIVLRVEGLSGLKCKEELLRKIQKMPGIEMVDVDERNGKVSVTGGDLDQLYVEDAVEALGYKILH